MFKEKKERKKVDMRDAFATTKNTVGVEKKSRIVLTNSHRDRECFVVQPLPLPS
jgi:hypothetical protein